jgi:hypothetical protein
MTLPGTKPACRVHVPPPPTGQLPDPGGATPAQRCFNLQRQVADLYDRYRSSIPEGVDPDELRDNAGAFVASDANAQLHPALAAVKGDADQAARNVNDLINATQVGGDTASLLAAQSYWQRKQRVLDNIKDKSKLVAAAQALVKNANAEELPVLVRELTDCHRSKTGRDARARQLGTGKHRVRIRLGGWTGRLCRRRLPR